MAEDLTLGAKLVELGLRGYDKLVDRSTLPANKRILLESTLDNNRQLITRDSFNPGELRAMVDLIKRKYSAADPVLDEYRKYLKSSIDAHNVAVSKKDRDHYIYPEFLENYQRDANAIDKYKQGTITEDLQNLLRQKSRNYYQNYALKEAYRGKEKPNLDLGPYIQYDNYKDAMSGRKIFGDTTPEQSVSTSLGQYNFNYDKDGNLNIKDNYDFNPNYNVLSRTSTKRPVSLEGVLASPLIGGLYNEIRAYAGEKIPEGSGRPVDIKMTPQELSDLFKRE